MKIVIDIDEELYNRVRADSGVYVMDDILVENAIYEGIPLPKCNQCKYYEGVHNIQGHAPCSYHNSGGVLWDWYCSQFEADKEKE